MTVSRNRGDPSTIRINENDKKRGIKVYVG